MRSTLAPRSPPPSPWPWRLAAPADSRADPRALPASSRRAGRGPGVSRGHRHRRPVVLRRQHHRRDDLPRRARRHDGHAVPARRPGRPHLRHRAQGDDGQLFVAGAATGRFFVYDVRSPASWSGRSQVAAPHGGADASSTTRPSAPDGSVYITDSQRPVPLPDRPARPRDRRRRALAVFLDFTGTAAAVHARAVQRERHRAVRRRPFLVLAQSNTRDALPGRRCANRAVSEIDLRRRLRSAGDGLVLRRHHALRRRAAGRAWATSSRSACPPTSAGHGRGPHHRPDASTTRRPRPSPAAGCWS